MSIRQELIVEEDEAGHVCRQYACFENSVEILVSGIRLLETTL